MLGAGYCGLNLHGENLGHTAYCCKVRDVSRMSCDQSNRHGGPRSTDCGRVCMRRVLHPSQLRAVAFDKLRHRENTVLAVHVLALLGAHHAWTDKRQSVDSRRYTGASHVTAISCSSYGGLVRAPARALRHRPAPTQAGLGLQGRARPPQRAAAAVRRAAVARGRCTCCLPLFPRSHSALISCAHKRAAHPQIQ